MCQNKRTSICCTSYCFLFVDVSVAAMRAQPRVPCSLKGTVHWISTVFLFPSCLLSVFQSLLLLGCAGVGDVGGYAHSSHTQSNSALGRRLSVDTHSGPCWNSHTWLFAEIKKKHCNAGRAFALQSALLIIASYIMTLFLRCG